MRRCSAEESALNRAVLKERPELLALSVENYGFAVIKGLVSPNRLEALRHELVDGVQRMGIPLQLGYTLPGAASVLPGLADLIASDEVIHCFRAALRQNNIVFTGHADAHLDLLSGWHRDSGETVDGGYFDAGYMTDSECRVYKAALYLQDTDLTDALKVVPGSHKGAHSDAAPEALTTSIGDVVIFDVRLKHAGNLPERWERVLQLVARHHRSLLGRHAESPLWADLRARLRSGRSRETRASVFFTFGADNGQTDRFSAANQARQRSQLGGLGPGEIENRLRMELTKVGVRYA